MSEPRSARQRMILLGAALPLLVVLLALLQPQARQSREAFLKTQQSAGWVLIGSFGEHWPARPVKEATGQGELQILRNDGTSHHYQGFEGYALRAIYLRDQEDAETILVLRSSEKQEFAPRIEHKVEEQGLRR